MLAQPGLSVWQTPHNGVMSPGNAGHLEAAPVGQQQQQQQQSMLGQPDLSVWQTPHSGPLSGGRTVF
jgi:hypothetical protein